MRNYRTKIDLGNGRYAYEQTLEAYNRGATIIKSIQSKWTPPSYYYHYRKGGHLAAIRQHQDSNSFSKIDLSSFYYQITKNKIIRGLKKVGFSFADADIISALSTVLVNGKFVLPFGFVQSSLISSLVMNSSLLGQTFRSKPAGISLSIYVDDIIVSGISNMRLVEEYSSEIINSATRCNFPINEYKTDLGVTSVEVFNIDMAQNYLRICEARMADFLKEMSGADNEDRAESMIRYVAGINNGQADLLRRMRNMRG